MARPHRLSGLLLAMALIGLSGCGGGGGGSGDSDPTSTDDNSLDPAVDFFMLGASIARPIFALDGDLDSLVNPASLYEVDPLTGAALAGFPKVLNAGTSLLTLAPINFPQVLDPLTPQVPLVPRNAAIVLVFSQDVDVASLGLSNLDPANPGLLAASSTIQLRTKQGAIVPARAFVRGKQVAIVGTTTSTLGFEPSPLVFDQTGTVIEDVTGHLRLTVTTGGVASTTGNALKQRTDKLGSNAVPLPINPGNSQLDAIVLQNDTGVVTFNGFLPDMTAPRLVRPVTLAGTLTSIGSVGGQALLADGNLATLPNTTANAGEGEWSSAVISITSFGNVTKYVVDRNFNVGSTAQFVLALGEILDPAVGVGDAYSITRTEFFEPVPPPLPSNPVELARVTVDPENVPRDPNDPQDLLNHDLRYFVTMVDENDAPRLDRWNPDTSTFLPVPPKTSLRLQFSEPMDVGSFRPYETFFVAEAELERTDPAFDDMSIGRVVSSVDGRTITFQPFLEDQVSPSASSYIGFGGTPSPKRLVLRTLPEQSTIANLIESALPDVLAQLQDLPEEGVRGINDLGGRGLGVPQALTDQGDPVNFLLVEGNPAESAFPPAFDFVIPFETLASSDPDYGAIVHRFMGQAKTSIFSYPSGVVHDTVTAGVEFKDLPPVDQDGNGTIDRRYIYGPRVVEVGLNLPGRLTGAPAVVIEHLIDNYNAPKPATFSNPNGEDFLVSVGFGLSVPISSPFGARFQHIYRAGDASPAQTDFRGVTLDLVGLAWAPFVDPPNNIFLRNTKLDGFEVLVGLSGANRGRGPNTNQTNGIPSDTGSGLGSQFDCNRIEYHDNCCQDALTSNFQEIYDDEASPPMTAVVKKGTPYTLSNSNLFKPANAGTSTGFNNYLDYPAFNAGVDPYFGKTDVFSYPYTSQLPMLIEYRVEKNIVPPAINLFRFSPGILTSALPRFRIWSQGQHQQAHCVPNYTVGAPNPCNDPTRLRGGEGGPLLEPGCFVTAVAPEGLVNTMPTIQPSTYILPPHDPSQAGCPSRQPEPDWVTGELDTNNMSPTKGCITVLPKCNTLPEMNWYFANGFLAYPLPNTVAYPGPTGAPPTAFYGYGLPLGAIGAVIPNQPPCAININLGFSNQPGVLQNEPGMTPAPAIFGDNSRYYMMWKYQKRVSIIESPTVRVDGNAVTYLRPIVDPPLALVEAGADLVVEVRAGAQLDFAIAPLGTGYVDIGESQFSSLVSGEDGDHVYAKFRATFGTAKGSVQPPSLESIVMPYRKGAP